eukprot:TRINITY_DN3917_c0_g1_i1.p1 TRINITY_DN3917_c0_g1~~TRINITY_DN3917_c0_g1_i1.p1  ORF type:complete len:1233 (-),score=200.97 TRINITY_DN3917_c0_g1_i1:30-3662(-)
MVEGRGGTLIGRASRKQGSAASLVPRGIDEATGDEVEDASDMKKRRRVLEEENAIVAEESETTLVEQRGVKRKEAFPIETDEKSIVDEEEEGSVLHSATAAEEVVEDSRIEANDARKGEADALPNDFNLAIPQPPTLLDSKDSKERDPRRKSGSGEAASKKATNGDNRDLERRKGASKVLRPAAPKDADKVHLSSDKPLAPGKLSPEAPSQVVAHDPPGRSASALSDQDPASTVSEPEGKANLLRANLETTEQVSLTESRLEEHQIHSSSTETAPRVPAESVVALPSLQKGPAGVEKQVANDSTPKYDAWGLRRPLVSPSHLIESEHALAKSEHTWERLNSAENFSMVLGGFLLVPTCYLFTYTCGSPKNLHSLVDKDHLAAAPAMNFVAANQSQLPPIWLSAASTFSTGLATSSAFSDFRRTTKSDDSQHSAGSNQASESTRKEDGGGGVDQIEEEDEGGPVSMQGLVNVWWGETGSRGETKDPPLTVSDVRATFVVRKRWAYVVLVDSSADVEPAILTAQSLRLVGAQHELVLLFGRNMPESAANDPRFALHFSQIRHFRRDSALKAMGMTQVPHGLRRLQTWMLTDFDKVIYLDPSILVLDNLDHLFLRPTFAASARFYWSQEFSASLMVLRPCNVTFRALLGHAAMSNVSSSTAFWDEDILNQFFADWHTLPVAHRLPFRYNGAVYPPLGPILSNECKPIDSYWCHGPLSVINVRHASWYSPSTADKSGLTHNQSIRDVVRQEFVEEQSDGGLLIRENNAADDARQSSLGNSTSAEKLDGDIWAEVWNRLSHALEAREWRPLAEGTLSLVEVLGEEVASLTQHLSTAVVSNSNISDNNTSTGAAASLERKWESARWRWQPELLTPPKIPPAVRKSPLTSLLNDTALVTAAWDTSSLAAAAVLASSYNRYHRNPPRALVLMVAANLKEAVWGPFRSLFHHVVSVVPLQIIRTGRQGMPSQRVKLPRSFLLLYAWRLTPYRRVVFVHPLSLFLAGCKPLFNVAKPFAAVPSSERGDFLSSRLMVLQPSANIHQDMMQKLKMPAYPISTADSFLNAYFNTWYAENASEHHLPLQYSVDVSSWPEREYRVQPWKLIAFDVQRPPWLATINSAIFQAGNTSLGLPRIDAVAAWKRTFCQLATPHQLHWECSRGGAILAPRKAAGRREGDKKGSKGGKPQGKQKGKKQKEASKRKPVVRQEEEDVTDFLEGL